MHTSVLVCVCVCQRERERGREKIFHCILSRQCIVVIIAFAFKDVCQERGKKASFHASPSSLKKMARLGQEKETVERAVVEDTVEEAVEEAVKKTAMVPVENESVEETVEDTIDETVEKPLETRKNRGLSGAATYRCTFKKEWSTRWPFITMGTTSSFYWCSVCRQENS